MMRQFELVERVKRYEPDADEKLLDKAYVFALKAHGTQIRASGDPYFSHPLEVAAILTDLRLDVPSIATALLHDVVEDTHVSVDDIREKFGDEIAGLVDGVTKLSQLEFLSERTKDAENLRKLLLAMASDIRVLLVKMADRLHNMRTLHHIRKPEKRVRVAQETMDIYAPLAGRMGMQNLREELEDLAFAELNADARDSIVRRMKFLTERSGDLIGRISDQIRRRLAEEGITAEVSGRLKRPFSIWRKMQQKGITFEQLSDIIGFRVIVGSVDACYRALGVLHTAWPMVPERFKDFISVPKGNNYRSIHTTVIGPERQRVEIQIRTADMHDVAERGVAAHWSYKDKREGLLDGPDSAYSWLRDLVETLEGGGTPEDYLEHTKLQMFHDQVFCFTPKGQVIALPRGATPIDFAYAVHTEIGDTCVGAKVNGRPVPLRTVLGNGQMVEIVRAPNQTPQASWEAFVVTGRARAAIRRHIRAVKRDEHVKLGRQVLEQAFATSGETFAEKALEPALKRFRFAKADELFEALGEGVITASETMRAIFPGFNTETAAALDPKRKKGAIPIQGLAPGIAYHLAGCCHPIPGDRIVGIVTPGQGVVVHTIDCEKLEAFQGEPDRWLDLTWTAEARESGQTGRLDVVLDNEPGALGALAVAIGKAGGNISNLRFTGRQPAFFEMLVDIEVADVKHLTNIVAALRANPVVQSVERVRGETEAA